MSAVSSTDWVVGSQVGICSYALLQLSEGIIRGVEVVHRVRLTVRGCLSAFSATPAGYKQALPYDMIMIPSLHQSVLVLRMKYEYNTPYNYSCRILCAFSWPRAISILSIIIIEYRMAMSLSDQQQQQVRSSMHGTIYNSPLPDTVFNTTSSGAWVVPGST